KKPSIPASATTLNEPARRVAPRAAPAGDAATETAGWPLRTTAESPPRPPETDPWRALKAQRRLNDAYAQGHQTARQYAQHQQRKAVERHQAAGQHPTGRRQHLALGF